LQLGELQKGLISKAMRNEDFKELKSRKQKILSDGVRQKQLEERTNSIMAYIESRPDLIAEYDDLLIRFFIEKILVFRGRFSVELKTGIRL